MRAGFTDEDVDHGRLYLYSMNDLGEDLDAIAKMANWLQDEADGLDG